MVRISHIFSFPGRLFAYSLPSSVLLYILRNYIPQLPVRPDRCMVLAEDWVREKGSQAICHVHPHWIFSMVLTLNSFFLKGPTSGWLVLDPARRPGSGSNFVFVTTLGCYFSSPITAWWGPYIQFSVFEVLEWFCFLDWYSHLYWYCSPPKVSVRWWVYPYSIWGKGRKVSKSCSINAGTPPWDCYHWVNPTACRTLSVYYIDTLFLLSVDPWWLTSPLCASVSLSVK